MLILTIDQPDGRTNHKAGWIGFGRRRPLHRHGRWWWRGGEPDGNAQNVNSLLGKMLRIDVHGVREKVVAMYVNAKHLSQQRVDVLGVAIRVPRATTIARGDVEVAVVRLESQSSQPYDWYGHRVDRL